MSKLWSVRQKEKGVRLEVNWWTGRNCWRKKIGGRMYYFWHPNSALGYSAAVGELHALLKGMRPTKPRQEDYDHHLMVLGRCEDWYARFGEPEEECGLQEAFSEFANGLKKEIESADDPRPLSELLDEISDSWNNEELSFFVEVELLENHLLFDHPLTRTLGKSAKDWKPNDKWRERFRQLGDPRNKKVAPVAVGHWIEEFLEFKRIQAKADELTSNTWGDLSGKLRTFEAWIGKGTDISTIDGSTLKRYYRHLLERKANGSIGASRAHNLFRGIKQFIRWAWREDECPLENLPRNINDRELRFSVQSHARQGRTRSEQLFTKDDIKQMLELLPSDFCVFILLSLNCGFTQVDIASLRQDELRLDEGRIVRQRTKTKRHPNPPIVNYKLWNKTLELLRASISDHPQLALLSHRKTPLIVDTIVEVDGKSRHRRYDLICRQFNRLRKAHPTLPDKSLKFLRKTGSSKLRSEIRYMGLDQLYLGHSHQSIADRHYNAFDGQIFPPLDEAIQWLGEQFGLAATPAPIVIREVPDDKSSSQP